VAVGFGCGSASIFLSDLLHDIVLYDAGWCIARLVLVFVYLPLFFSNIRHTKKHTFAIMNLVQDIAALFILGLSVRDFSRFPLSRPIPSHLVLVMLWDQSNKRIGDWEIETQPGGRANLTRSQKCLG
jgi:hypothetical protein